MVPIYLATNKEAAVATSLLLFGLLNQRASLATVLMGDVKNMQAKKQPINKWQPTTERDISRYATLTTELTHIDVIMVFQCRIYEGGGVDGWLWMELTKTHVPSWLNIAYLSTEYYFMYVK